MNADRAAALRAMLDEDPEDAFALYGLAMEHKAGDDLEAAEALLRRVLAVQPTHLYGHYQLAEVLLADLRPDEAAEVLDAGIEHARGARDGKALSELQALRDECE
ncbi:MAG: tetratricopeptide repeat protein [Myxococcales bacterium]|nr:tetratricopeptide repeat protein [Myxococcales bacterium]MCB9524186.1 tetratricopeptide repeat protein [Myxococcales bacterium]